MPVLTIHTRKPCYRKDYRAMRPICGRPEKFRESLATTPTANFPEIVNDCCCDRSYESAPDGPCWDQPERIEALSYSSVKFYFRRIPTYVIIHGTVPERYRRTDGQTERQYTVA